MQQYVSAKNFLNSHNGEGFFLGNAHIILKKTFCLFVSFK